LAGALHHHYYAVNVHSDRDVNSGRESQTLLSPRFSAVYNVTAAHQIFVNAGRGFHSNDARGATSRVDPIDGVSTLDPVDLLVATDARDLGCLARFKRWQWSVDLFELNIDSELLFIGDGGTTEATRASRRRGVELAGFWQWSGNTLVDLSWARSQARFLEAAAEGNFIPGAPKSVAALGLSYSDTRYSFGLRWRYLGSRALHESGTPESPSSVVLNLNAGWMVNRSWQITLSLLNALDREHDGVRYYYLSRLADEASAQWDEHFHPIEPRTVRLATQVNW
jgi:outer membrane receptor protein involved in Fe transport